MLLGGEYKDNGLICTYKDWYNNRFICTYLRRIDKEEANMFDETIKIN